MYKYVFVKIKKYPETQQRALSSYCVCGRLLSTRTVSLISLLLTQGGGGTRPGVLGYDLGGYVPPRSPNLDPVLERICIQNGTPF